MRRGRTSMKESTKEVAFEERRLQFVTQLFVSGLEIINAPWFSQQSHWMLMSGYHYQMGTCLRQLISFKAHHRLPSLWQSIFTWAPFSRKTQRRYLSWTQPIVDMIIWLCRRMLTKASTFSLTWTTRMSSTCRKYKIENRYIKFLCCVSSTDSSHSLPLF